MCKNVFKLRKYALKISNVICPRAKDNMQEYIDTDITKY